MECDKEKKLALSIGSCENFRKIINGEKLINGKENPCRSIVQWQLDKHESIDNSSHEPKDFLHCPEPWAGNLTEARVIFLSSNPSFNEKENFPTLSWKNDETSDFFINRFSSEKMRQYGATEGSGLENPDKAILKDGTQTKRVRTWSQLRKRASVLIDRPPEDTLASRDYVMTEVVHCKSHKEIGVQAALTVCVNKWLKQILALSSARLVVVSGKPAGKAIKQAIPELTNGTKTLDEKWGSWSEKSKPLGSGEWPKSWAQLDEWKAKGRWTFDDQSNHVQEINLELEGESRTSTFLWMPHPVRAVPQDLSNERLYDPRSLSDLRQAAAQNPSK